MEKLNVPCVVQEIETPLGIVRVTDRTGKIIPMHVCRNGVDIDYPIPGTEENLQEVPVPENHYWLMLDENDLEEGELYQIALETDKVRYYEHYDPECGFPFRGRRGVFPSAWALSFLFWMSSTKRSCSSSPG